MEYWGVQPEGGKMRTLDFGPRPLRNTRYLAAFTAGAVVSGLLSALDRPAAADPPSLVLPGRDPLQATTSKSARQDAVRSIPFEQLDPEGRNKVNSVLSNLTVFRRMPTRVIDCDPGLYLFLVEHPDVNKVAFTGSTEVGKAIQRAVAGTNKKLTLELGGKAANVVFDDAPIDQAIEGIVNGIYFNQGHVCCAGSRLLLQESIAEEAIDALKRRLQTLRLGDPMDKNTDIGAINSRMQLNKIEELTKSGEDEGAERWSPNCPIPDKGFWFPPTVFTNVTQAHRIAREEIFGPVLSVLTFRTPEEAVEKANNTPFGLSTGIWTEKGSRILWMANKVRSGIVWANTFNRFDPASPFGGYKESGFGREGGVQGLGAYLHVEDPS